MKGNQLQCLCAQLKTRTSHDSLLTMWVTYTARGKACNDVGDSTLSATSDPIVASTLADPPYITEVVVTGDVELTVFLDAAWNGGSVVTGHVCTGASVWVFTGEVLVISELVARHAYWFQCAARTAESFSPFSTASQMVIAKAPPLPPVFLSFLLKIKRSWWRRRM